MSFSQTDYELIIFALGAIWAGGRLFEKVDDLGKKFEKHEERDREDFKEVHKRINDLPEHFLERRKAASAGGD